MKKHFYSLTLFLFLAFYFSRAYSQCNLTYYAGIGVANTGTTFTTWANFGPGQYFAMPVLNGGSYSISSCGAPINTQLTGWDASASSVIFYNDDNGPFCTGTSASINNYVPNFTNYMYVQVTQSNCVAGGASSINLYLRQNDNLAFTSSNAAMCSGQTRNLTATPANVGSTPGGYGNPGTFSGTGVAGNVFTAPVVATSTTYTITYTFGYVSKTQTITVNPSCLPGEALHFDGLNDYVNLSAFNINGAAPRTVEFWLKTMNMGVFQTPFSSGNPSNNQAFNVKITPTGHLGFMGFNNDNYPSTGTMIADNFYHHVALSYDGALMSAYVDGNLEWTFPVSLATTGTSNILGASNHGSAPDYFVGNIDELRVWDVARTQCEIKSYISCEIPTIATGLLVNYHFNQGLRDGANPTVTSLTDASGNTYNGTLLNFNLTGTTSNWIAPGAVTTGSFTPANLTPTVTVNSGAICSGNSFTMIPSGATTYSFSSGSAVVSPTTTTSYTVTGTTAGCSNTAVSTVTVNTCTPAAALNFDGADDYVQNVSPTIPTMNAFTLETWLKVTNTTNFKIFSSAEIELGVVSGQMELYSPTLVPSSSNNVSSIPTNTWKHLAVTFDGASLKFYIDGVLDNTLAKSGTIAANTGFKIGKHLSANCCFMNGSMDEFRIWNVARTQCEINSYKNCEIPSTATGLVANYHFNQGYSAQANPGITTLNDVSGSANTGQLINFALIGAASNWIAPGAVISGSVTPPTLPASTITASPALCNGGSTGSATVTATGGTGAYTYLWSTAATTSVITGQTAGVKTVTVTDANACKTATSVTISQPSAIATSTAVTNILCNGGSNGSATVTATGGTGAYTYLWSTAATASVITGQTAGVKTVTVTDANTCKTTNSVTITQPSAIATSTAVTNILCNGGSTGSATVTATGGTGAYTYLWSTAVTTSVITAQTAGVKTVTVTDANACARTNSVTITQPSSLIASVAVTTVVCNGGSNGSATVTASGGTGAYTYLWSTAATTSVITGQTVGIKTATVTDANGCSAIATGTIVQPSALVTSTAAIPVLCNGGSNGSATVTATGGTAGYTYLWSTAATTSVITGQTAGIKTVTVTDANGCSTTNSITITQPVTALATSTAVANVLCFGGTTGAATVTPSGGTAGYTYLWSTSATTSVITSQAAGVKTVTVTDANGCTTTNSVTITQPATAVSSATAATNVLCFGGSTGSATVTPSGGTAGYTYLWSTAATTSVVTGQTAGVKTVTVTDANGCTTTNSVTITQPASGLSATQTQTNVTCVVNGMASVSASGGSSPYTYTWSPTGGNAATSTTLAAGNYTATIEDANNCTFANVFAITANTVAPVVAVSGSTAICNGSNSTLTASGANTYLWSTSATTSSISVSPTVTTTYSVTGTSTINSCTTSITHTLTVYPNPTVTATASSTIICTAQSATLTAGGAGTYTWSTGSNATSIVVTPTTTTSYTLNGNGPTGCPGSATISITVVNTPTVTAVSSSSAICAGASATLTANGASTYSWSTGATTSTITVSPTSNTTYTVNGMVGAGCNNTGTVSVVVNATPSLSIAVSQASVCPSQTSTLTASGALTYTWNTGSNATSITSTPIVPIAYTVTGSNAAGCTNTATQTIGLFPVPTINIGSSSASVCAGFSSTLTATGVNTYTWNTGSNNASISVSPTSTTTYSVNGSDINGCVASNSITIAISTTPTLIVVASSTGICNGSSSNLTVSGATSYVWSTGDTGASITVSPSASTVYSVTGTNGAGCVSGATVDVTVYVSPTVSIGADAEVAFATDYQFNPSQTGAVSYTWSPATYLSSVSVINPVTTPESDITYILTVSSLNGCTASDTVMIKVLTELVLANYMSPNGDGDNDTWKASVPGLIKDYSVTIIDSYGRTVFSVSGNYNNEFDGKLGGKDLPDGAYYYFIKDGKDTKYKGSITLTK